METIFTKPELFKFNVGDVVFYDAYRNNRMVMFSGVIHDAHITELNEVMYVVNDTTLAEDRLYRSVEEYRANLIVESREDFNNALTGLYTAIEERNQLLADFIMKSREVNGSMPDTLNLLISGGEKTIIRTYINNDNDVHYFSEIVDRFSISKNDNGEYEFCFISNKYGFEIPESETVDITSLIINNTLEDYVSKIKETF